MSYKPQDQGTRTYMTQNNTSKQNHSINNCSVSNLTQQHFTSSKPEFHPCHCAITTWDKTPTRGSLTPPLATYCLYSCSSLTSYFCMRVDFKGFFHSAAMDSTGAGQKPLIGSLPGRENQRSHPAIHSAVCV